MTFSQFLKELEDIEDGFEKDENEIDFTMLKMLQSILKQKGLFLNQTLIIILMR